MLQLKTVYTLAELARAAQLDTRRIRRLLTAQGVAIQSAGPRSKYVFLADIRTHMPKFWESILEYETTRSLEQL